MSSFQIRNIREIPSDPIAKFADSLAKKLSAFLTKDQLELLDDKEDIYTDGRDVEGVVKFHNNLISTKTFDFATTFYPPTEPDYNKLTLWLRGRNTGSNHMKDWSGFDNDIDLVRAEPSLIDGTPFDYGIHTDGVKSICMRFNRPDTDTENLEHIKIHDNARLQVSGISTGMSYFIRFRVKDLAQQGSINRTLFEKIDDSTPNNGVMLQLSATGRLIFFIIIGGTLTKVQTDAGTISVDTVYEVWVTYAVSGNTVHIYVNNVDKTLSTPSDSANWQSTKTNHDLFMFRRGFGSDGFVYGDFYDFELFKEKVVSSTEVGRHYTNKWTIANIPFGQVMITDYWATYGDLSGSSFTSQSFTSQSFNT